MNHMISYHPATEALEASVKRRRRDSSEAALIGRLSSDYSSPGRISFEMTSLYQEATAVMDGELLQFPTIVWLSDSEESAEGQVDSSSSTVTCRTLDSFDSVDEDTTKTKPKVVTNRKLLKRKGSEAFGCMVRSKSLSKELSKLDSFTRADEEIDRWLLHRPDGR